MDRQLNRLMFEPIYDYGHYTVIYQYIQLKELATDDEGEITPQEIQESK